MDIYSRGAVGPEVERIQQRLKELGQYTGPVDGIFGGGTMVAVKAFQRACGLAVDGVVGPRSWERLFGGEALPAPAIAGRPLAHRTLALTAALETSAPPPECFCGVSGDFDGQGISFGALQWCLGQNSLQPLLREMDRRHGTILEEIFDERCEELRAMLGSDLSEQLDWARAIQNARGRLVEPWLGLFKTLGRRPEFQQIQVEAADGLYQDALELCRRFGVVSERAVALMFDIKVQNGSISPLVERQIRQDFDDLAREGRAEDETARLCAIAERRAAAAKPRWVADVRRRKMMIATGQGVVHGGHFDLERQYGIALRPVAGL